MPRSGPDLASEDHHTRLQSAIRGFKVLQSDIISNGTFIGGDASWSRAVLETNYTDGALSESFCPSALSLSGLDRDARAEILSLFPGLSILTHAFAHTAGPVIWGRDVAALRPVLKTA